jgi:hypothetical protein
MFIKGKQIVVLQQISTASGKDQNESRGKYMLLHMGMTDVSLPPALGFLVL